MCQCSPQTFTKFDVSRLFSVSSHIHLQYFSPIKVFRQWGTGDLHMIAIGNLRNAKYCFPFRSKTDRRYWGGNINLKDTADNEKKRAYQTKEDTFTKYSLRKVFVEKARKRAIYQR